ncbi:hypothetical protein ACNQVK_24680 [Mycobacterium sp. 134]|uniref:hypothetical protein n=1 Tax=Mycobacterium sp. 134 TaxID=3400425 RepID=UPI003AAF5720
MARERVNDLLTDTTTAEIPAQLQPLADMLVAASPWGVMQWLSKSVSAEILRILVRQKLPITHDVLDRFPQHLGLRGLREILVTATVLPERRETVMQLQLWADAMIGELPQPRQNIIRPFAEWSVIRDARSRAERGRYTPGAAALDRAQIRAAIRFLNWLDYENITLLEVSQIHLDMWLDIRPSSRWALGVTPRQVVNGVVSGSR